MPEKASWLMTFISSSPNKIYVIGKIVREKVLLNYVCKLLFLNLILKKTSNRIRANEDKLLLHHELPHEVSSQKLFTMSLSMIKLSEQVEKSVFFSAVIYFYEVLSSLSFIKIYSIFS